MFGNAGNVYANTIPNVSLNGGEEEGVYVHNSFVEPPDLSPLMELTLSIDDVVSLIAKVL